MERRFNASRRSSTLGRESDAADCGGSRGPGDGWRDFRRHAEGIWRVQGSSGNLATLRVSGTGFITQLKFQGAFHAAGLDMVAYGLAVLHPLTILCPGSQSQQDEDPAIPNQAWA